MGEYYSHIHNSLAQTNRPLQFASCFQQFALLFAASRRLKSMPRVQIRAALFVQVVCDVPCSGTGALRRSPEMKWKYNDEKVRLQRRMHAASSSCGILRILFEYKRHSKTTRGCSRACSSWISLRSSVTSSAAPCNM